MTNQEGWKLVGKVPVDSGSLLIGDPSYFFSNAFYNAWFDSVMSDSKHDFNHEDIHLIKEKLFREVNGFKARIGTFNSEHIGLVTNTGYGDGIYLIYVKRNKEDRIIELRIRFDIVDPNNVGDYTESSDLLKTIAKNNP